MSNQLYMPRTNALNFYEIQPVALPQYHSRPFDQFPFRETLKDWEISVCYYQKFQNNDVCPLQYLANFTGGQLDLVNSAGRVYNSVTVNALLQSIDNPGFWFQEAVMTFAGIPEGVYFVKLSNNGTDLLISEPVQVKPDWPGTLLFQVANQRFHNDLIFETGFIINFRVEGAIGRVSPGVEEVYFKDQRLSNRLLSGRTYNKLNVNIGGNRGVPDWAIEKIVLLFSCSDVMIDGRFYAKAVEGDLEFIEEEFYALRAINVMVVPGINRVSNIINPDLNTNARLTVVYNIRSAAIFGNIGAPDDRTIIITQTTE